MYVCTCTNIYKYNLSPFIVSCAYTVSGLTILHWATKRLLLRGNCPSSSSHYFLIVLCLRMWPHKIIPFRVNMIFDTGIVSFLFMKLLSKRDGFTTDFPVFWLLTVLPFLLSPNFLNLRCRCVLLWLGLPWYVTFGILSSCGFLRWSPFTIKRGFFDEGLQLYLWVQGWDLEWTRNFELYLMFFTRHCSRSCHQVLHKSLGNLFLAFFSVFFISLAKR